MKTREIAETLFMEFAKTAKGLDLATEEQRRDLWRQAAGYAWEMAEEFEQTSQKRPVRFPRDRQ